MCIKYTKVYELPFNFCGLAIPSCSDCPVDKPDVCNCGVCGSYGGCSFSCNSSHPTSISQGLTECQIGNLLFRKLFLYLKYFRSLKFILIPISLFYFPTATTSTKTTAAILESTNIPNSGIDILLDLKKY